MARNQRRRPNPRDLLSQPAPSWHWRTLPVWLALTGGIVIGWYIAAVGANWRLDRWSVIALYVVLSLFSFGLSRIISRYTAIWVARRRARTSEKRILSSPETRRSGRG